LVEIGLGSAFIFSQLGIVCFRSKEGNRKPMLDLVRLGHKAV